MESTQGFKISLNNLRFYSRIGVSEQERTVGNEFEVTVSVIVPADGFEYENLETSISYADIYEEVAAIMRGEYLLLESVAKKIAEKICSRWEGVKRAEVSVSKLSVPISGMQGTASVEFFIEKS